MTQSLLRLAQDVANQLTRRHLRIVFAESCTGGLVSATLARIPGISEFLCGSAVVYRLNTKTRWLGVPESILVNPGPVSECVARTMAEGVLSLTPEAELSASITGHLGPNAPAGQDGVVYVGVAVRGHPTSVVEHRLPSGNDGDKRQSPSETEREYRQRAAVEVVLAEVSSRLNSIEIDR